MKMNMYPSLVSIRSYLSEQFFSLHRTAFHDSLWARLIGKNTKLAIFPEQAPQKSPNRRLVGTKDILVEQIVGTFGRQNDFDYKFRPLKKYLRDRWVNVYLTHESNGWSPIVVHKVGENYYVEDGHHRVSVARSLGIVYIQAKVWEYPINVKPPRQTKNVPCPEKARAKVFATGEQIEASQ